MNTQNKVRNIARVKRYRNGRLAVDVMSRRQKPRWRMLMMNGDWYDRDSLRAEMRAMGHFVPQTRRALAQAEVAHIQNSEPWRLMPR